ncbi:MAG TPA: hypothetical protein VI306_10630 [Pyrinomonadaceae bacterium]
MKKIILTLTFLLATCTVASAQYNTENLRGLQGVRLVVMFGRAEGLPEDQRPELLKALTAEATAKLQNAGIPLFKWAHESQAAGFPDLEIRVTLDKPNGFVHPLVTEVKLMQRVKLVRDLTIETDAITWRLEGVGGPTLDLPMIHRQVAGELDHFISDYLSVNPKQTAVSIKKN